MGGKHSEVAERGFLEVPSWAMKECWEFSIRQPGGFISETSIRVLREELLCWHEAQQCYFT